MTAYYNEHDPTRNGVAYCATNLATGKRYIGITVQGVSRRWRGHLKSARDGSKSALHAAIRKYGDNVFVVCEIACSLHADYRAELERALIEQEGTRAPSGYNLTIGGDGTVGLPCEVIARIADKNRGRKHSEKARLAIGAASSARPRTAETRLKISEKHKGKRLSLEHRQKLSAAKIGRRLPPRSDDHSAKISTGLVRAWARRKASALK